MLAPVREVLLCSNEAGLAAFLSSLSVTPFELLGSPPVAIYLVAHAPCCCLWGGSNVCDGQINDKAVVHQSLYVFHHRLHVARNHLMGALCAHGWCALYLPEQDGGGHYALTKTDAILPQWLKKLLVRGSRLRVSNL